MKEKLLWACLIFLTVYMAIPWIVTRILGLGIFRRGRSHRQIAFTFDDGPDPRYTPELLDLLQSYGVKATFFVLGAKAERYPELIRRIHAEGHQIGIHNYTHLSNWLMAPWTVRSRQVGRTEAIIADITGVRPTYYRPPWGIINFGDFWLRRRYRIILWSLMGRDWDHGVGPEKLKRRLLNGIKGGSVVLLHDSGDTFGADEDAPAHMLRALREVLAEVTASGYECVRVDELYAADSNPAAALGIPRRMLRSAWMLWERLFLKLLNIQTVNKLDPLLKLRVIEYSGSEPLTFPDGEQFRKGDRIAEIHFDNDMLLQFSVESRSPVQMALHIIRGMERQLPMVLKLLMSDPKYSDVKGLYGISMIHRGSKNLGFAVFDLPKGAFAFVTRYYLRIVMYMLHPQGKERLKTKPEQLVPKIIAMSRKEMMSRYIA